MCNTIKIRYNSDKVDYLQMTLSCITLVICGLFCPSCTVSLQLYSAVSVLFTLVIIRVALSVSLTLKRGKPAYIKGLLDGESLSAMVDEVFI